MNDGLRKPDVHPVIVLVLELGFLSASRHGRDRLEAPFLERDPSQGMVTPADDRPLPAPFLLLPISPDLRGFVGGLVDEALLVCRRDVDALAVEESSRAGQWEEEEAHVEGEIPRTDELAQRRPREALRAMRRDATARNTRRRS